MIYEYETLSYPLLVYSCYLSSHNIVSSSKELIPCPLPLKPLQLRLSGE
jgi:hypothetical protein